MRARKAYFTSSLVLLMAALITAATQAAPTLQDLGLKASYIQGAVVRGQAPEGFEVSVNGKVLRKGPQGEFVFGLGRDATDVVLAVQGANQPLAVLPLAIESRTYNIQRVDGVPAKTVTPPKAQLERIHKESALARAARDVDSQLTDFSQAFQWPLTGRITGVYGSQRVYNGVPKNPHFGVDVARPTGTVVVAPVGGNVRLAYDDMFFSGGTLIVDHGHGLTSTFIHLSEILVEEGQRVEQGDPIAKVGATGRATGPHLDWRMNWFDERVDPQTLVGPMPGQ
ncbi:M23 family metallopeptidase [Simiduia sp. 21SJ11W-1]|uniref:M23 family metallopeptidase n=1 Tax=Simiduia sp. 21SJ11W-1 TaxID=2909669 RepID=UPI0020A10571|nr:M23 family metallopeptidase [Simiduia sp. 21SJ11W-1]UTA49222.1 M23 family metallopeptidase [Simiduia sp. 21SJ11W-1]